MIIVGNRTSTTVKSLETANGTYTYTYDAVGNILSINDGTYTVSYVYDGLNQLVRENDQRADTTTVYTYTNGNITGKKVYKYTLGNVGEEIKSTSYGYSNSEWRDLLTSFNGQAVTYDEIGNLITFGSKTFEWCGRQLERITDGDNTYVYAYNTDGDRVSKTVNGVKTEYFYNGSILAGQKTGDETLIFMYDNNGDAFGFTYNGEEYYYIKNVQNDIVAIADKNGTVVANYYYDAWGNVTQITGNTALAQTNPLRYRSYYYDSETGYYHLKSRYYSPEVGRFLNADGIINANNDVFGNNLFVYCSNNPVNRVDHTGQFWSGIWEFAKTAVAEIGKAMGVMSPAYAGCGGVAVADGPLPFGDIVAAAGVALLTVGVIGYGIYQATKAPAVSTPKAEEKAEAIPATPPTPTVIYRYGGTNPGNLTPKAKDKYTGLSFSTVPMPGAAVTTIEALNATGVVYAVQDGPTHVSVRPVGATMEDWINAGSGSIWTQAVKSVVVKWDRGY
mgnify:CR=1 FL=1